MKQYLSGIGFKVVQEANQNSPGAEAGNGIVGVHYAAVKHRNPEDHEEMQILTEQSGVAPGTLSLK